ncbi:type VI secretion system lipoprotein TssJ [Burkholderia ambifaria]|uniref:type VI secretion system lipoprotein TssJ n=1 Tax=Burkholderia ambifaria TaxID=152480 RepID=UPI00158B74C0|nr:type VI secretion system lipoprotein TssJ [Burkholderia ambifaria]UEP23358.1 type VI secretion system lipoprotein TssJ [Burkholderia ambifaria]WAS56456.1 type VI secretion system lipoprotein TssJ [Burkholderia ambifaria]WDR86200.1 type VI secretion system lipoprotein TssJ [Burkholderia ambifaria]WDR98835.1 type VI secretion system lipoprotein TssJ [Burkholderia ambifaria]
MFYRMSAATAAAVLLLSGCGAWQSVSDASSNAYHAVFFKQVKVLDVDLTARAALNPDDAGRPTSVAVRVYQLTDRKMFDAASYDDLLKNDRTVLAQDLQADMSATVSPGASSSLSQPMQRETKYVAIVALYRVPGAAEDWKKVVEKKRLDPDKPLRIGLTSDRLEMAGDIPK